MHSKEQSKSLLEAVTHYSKSLDAKALEYLEGRGISEDVALQFSLGLVTDPINGHENHAGWLSIPYLTALGMCVGNGTESCGFVVTCLHPSSKMSAMVLRMMDRKAAGAAVAS